LTPNCASALPAIAAFLPFTRHSRARALRRNVEAWLTKKRASQLEDFRGLADVDAYKGAAATV